MHRIRLRPRYCRLNTDPGIPLAEANYRHAELEWDAPLSDFALVLVDVWDGHYSADTHARIDRITREQIAPLLAACRAAGLLIIHAPGSPLAERHPNWVNLCPDVRTFPACLPDSPAWPPPEFHAKQGRYALYARPHEPQDATIKQRFHAAQRDFHPAARPAPGEPVILNGEELHRVCAQRGVVHLIYVGFNTNACILMRDYGILAMSGRGYGTSLLRDCTTGMETQETQAKMVCTRGAIASIEQFCSYTLTSAELITALEASTVHTGGVVSSMPTP